MCRLCDTKMIQLNSYLKALSYYYNFVAVNKVLWKIYGQSLALDTTPNKTAPYKNHRIE